MINRKTEWTSNGIIVAILGARMHYAVPEILQKHKLLDIVYTDIYIGNKPWLEKILKLIAKYCSKVKTVLSRKSSILKQKEIISFDFLGLEYVIKRKRAKTSKDLIAVHIEINNRFNRKIISRIQNINNKIIIYGFNTASVELFKYIKQNNGICILEQTIAPKMTEITILDHEVEKFGMIDRSIEIDQEHPMIIREKIEWRLADLIIAPSQFVYEKLLLAGVEKEKCCIVPYGVDESKYTFIDKTRTISSESFNILFAGHVGMRKGVHYLLQAVELLKAKNITVKLAGNITLEEEYIKKYSQNVEFLGRVPRQEMKKLYEWADLFVFPSLCEGSATVIYEAIISGIPVVTSPNAGSIITSGVDGVIVEPQKIERLASILDELNLNIESYNKLVTGVQRNRYKASLETYEKNLINTLIDFLEKKSNGF